MDRIKIKDLHLRSILGVNDWEREKRQDVMINIGLSVDTSRAGRTDDIEDCVNYRTVTKNIISHVESAERETVEALADDIARICLREEDVEKVEVSVEKPGALRFSRSVGVEISRERNDFETLDVNRET